MSQQQYHNIMSSFLKEKHALASLRAKLEGRQERECWKCRGFGHWAQHCRKEEKEKGKPTPQNKFEILASRVMRCRVELRKQEVEKRWKVKCYKCGEEGHYHKWSLTICDGCFDTSKSSKMRSKASDKRCC